MLKLEARALSMASINSVAKPLWGIAPQPRSAVTTELRAAIAAKTTEKRILRAKDV